MFLLENKSSFFDFLTNTIRKLVNIFDSFIKSKLGISEVISEVGTVISHCKSIFSYYYRNTIVRFVRRQSNEIIH